MGIDKDEIIKITGRTIAVKWIKEAIGSSENNEQRLYQIAILNQVAYHLLATYALNNSDSRICKNPLSIGASIMQIKESIEEEVEEIKGAENETRLF